MFGSLSARRAPFLAQVRTFQLYKVKKVQYDFEKLGWKQYKKPPGLTVREQNLDAHLEWNATDNERITEMERYRISVRHLANIMGKDPKTFTYDDQIKAMKYLMPGYAMYQEANPKLEHPHEWMGPYKNAESLARRQHVRLNGGRPDHYLYFNKEITIIDALTKLNDIYNNLKKEANRIEHDLLNGKIKEYPDKYIECQNRTAEELHQEEKFGSPANFLGYADLEQNFIQDFSKALTKINRLPTSYLARDLLDIFQSEQQSHPDLLDDFYSTTIDEIEVLGEIQKNRHISSSLGCWNGQSQVNVTLIADGTGKMDVNGIPLFKFFKDDKHKLRALSPLIAMQRLNQFDAVISVVGAGHDNRAAKGKEMRKWVYSAGQSKMHLPYKGSNPRFGINIDHTAALLNGGAKIAMAISQGISIAIVPFISPKEAAVMKDMGFQLDNVKRKERHWFAGAGVGRIKGRKGKKWRRR